MRGGRTPRWFGRLLVFAGLVVGVFFAGVGCSSDRKQAWLEFFFDGVPDPNAPPELRQGPGGRRLTPAQLALTNAQAQAVARRARGSSHPPYASRECQKCHKSKFSQQLLLPREELCLSCHNTFLDGKDYLHSPAVAGACLMCHHPHRSERPHLLLASGAPLCLQCHEVRDLSRIPAHAEPLKLTCYECHNPHGGGNVYFLQPRKPAKAEPPPASAPAEGDSASSPPQPKPPAETG